MTAGYSDMRERLFAFVPNDSAVDFLDGMIGVAHLWDDLIDRDKPVTDDAINKAFWFMLVDLPRNDFYREHFNELNPIVMVSFMNWQAANSMERTGTSDDKHIAFILRSAYVDLVTLCALIVGGEDWAARTTLEIRRFAHCEGFAAYLDNLQTEINVRTGK
jgi:hypothetical protein